MQIIHKALISGRWKEVVTIDQAVEELGKCRRWLYDNEAKFTWHRDGTRIYFEKTQIGRVKNALDKKAGQRAAKRGRTGTNNRVDTSCRAN